MKSSRLFVLFILLFLGLMAWTEYHLPKKFRWLPTFSQYDKQPFGAAVFDDICSSSIPCGYAVSKETFYQMALHDTTLNRGILAVAQRMNLKKVDIDAVLRLAEQGNSIILAASSFSSSLCDTLGVNVSQGYFEPFMLKRQVSSMLLTRDTLQWVGDFVYSAQSYLFYSQLCTAFFLEADSAYRTLAYNGSVRREKLRRHDVKAQPDMPKNKGVKSQKHLASSIAGAVVLSRRMGKGELILVSIPLLMTNYGMLDANNATLIFRILSETQQKSLIRTEAYAINAQEEQSPFRFFLSHTPLRWALYFTVIVLIAFVFFTARRRQKAIPVIRLPMNKALEFIKLIGTLYFQKKDHAGLVRKKFVLFAEFLRRKVHVDVENELEDVEISTKLAVKLGVDEETILDFLHRIRLVMNSDVSVSEEQMRKLIDEMNEIRNLLNNV